MTEALTHVPTTSWSRRVRESLMFASFFVNPSRQRANVLYELVSTSNYLTDRTLFRNVGYWKHAPATLDEACEALALLAAEAAELGPQDVVLDAGFGYADQDMCWAERFAPRRIVGLNVTRSQVERARERVAARGMSDRIELHLAPATKIPFEAGSFDKVIALESAFHFHTREDFFREAFRVLRPGGRLVTLDMVPKPDQKLGFFARVLSAVGFHFWQISTENLYEPAEYASKLRNIGFAPVEVSSVFEDTLLPFSRYSLEQLQKPEIARKINANVAAMIALPAISVVDNPWGVMELDYILAVADKPR